MSTLKTKRAYLLTLLKLYITEHLIYFLSSHFITINIFISHSNIKNKNKN